VSSAEGIAASRDGWIIGGRISRVENKAFFLLRKDPLMCKIQPLSSRASWILVDRGVSGAG
jgi:hypothetical protein